MKKITNYFNRFLFLSAIVFISFLTHGQGAAKIHETIDIVTIHPPVAEGFVSSEHAVGQNPQPGNALGVDVMVTKHNKGKNDKFPSFYKNDGKKNEDWYSWEVTLLAPFDAVVKMVKENPVTNEPGNRDNGMAGGIIFESTDKNNPVQVLYAHAKDIKVKQGQVVNAGEEVAVIGNNAYSWFPHLHIGAVKGGLIKMLQGEVSPSDIEALQIRFDLKKMGN